MVLDVRDIMESVYPLIIFLSIYLLNACEITNKNT